MKIEVGRKWETSTHKVGLTTGCDHSVDVQHAVPVSRAVIFASSGEGSLLRGGGGGSVDIEGVVIVNISGIVASSCEGSWWFR